MVQALASCYSLFPVASLQGSLRSDTGPFQSVPISRQPFCCHETLGESFRLSLELSFLILNMGTIRPHRVMLVGSASSATTWRPAPSTALPASLSFSVDLLQVA